MKIWANCVVRDEENFVWFAIMSVVDFVDKVLVYDTGSKDKTVQIIKEIIKVKGDKVVLREVGKVSKEEFPKIRQRMLDESEADWILVLDGDEVWWGESMKKVIKEIKSGEEVDGVVVPFYVCVGDIYHYQDERAGRYELLGRRGYLSLRVINKKIPGLHVGLPYGKEGYFDSENSEVQKREFVKYVDAPYLHLTHLPRSGVRRFENKVKLELGIRFPSDFKYPEVFYLDYPVLVKSPWVNMRLFERIVSIFITPIKKFRRSFR